MLALDLDLRFEPMTNTLASLVRRGAHRQVVRNHGHAPPEIDTPFSMGQHDVISAPSISSLPD